MSHDYALLVVIDGNPIRDVKLVCFRVVQAAICSVAGRS